MKTRYALSLLALAGATPAFADVTTDLVQIGGEGSFGCTSDANPPTLDDLATVATGTIEYTYDSSTQVLTLVVSNTSPVDAGVPNPVITRIYANLPHSAVSGVSLLSQSAAGGPINFGLSTDTNLLDGDNSLTFGCIGAFGVLLTTSGAQGGIANPAADTVVASGAVDGPATFELSISGPGASNLTASAFSNSLSQLTTGSQQVAAGLKFQSGGPDEASGEMSSFIECHAGAWVVGEPCLGNPLDFVMTAAEGCHACLLYSLDPGPTVLGDLVIPIGLPVIPLLIVNAFPPEPIVLTVNVPENPALVGTEVYFIAAGLELLSGGGLSIADSFSLTICP